MSTTEFPLELQPEIQRFMATGRFATETDLLRAALAALDGQNANEEAIQDGLRDLGAGRTRPLDDIATEIRSRHGWNG